MNKKETLYFFSEYSKSQFVTPDESIVTIVFISPFGSHKTLFYVSIFCEKNEKRFEKKIKNFRSFDSNPVNVNKGSNSFFFSSSGGIFQSVDSIECPVLKTEKNRGFSIFWFGHVDNAQISCL